MSVWLVVAADPISLMVFPELLEQVEVYGALCVCVHMMYNNTIHVHVPFLAGDSAGSGCEVISSTKLSGTRPFFPFNFT